MRQFSHAIEDVPINALKPYRHRQVVGPRRRPRTGGGDRPDHRCTTRTIPVC